MDLAIRNKWISLRGSSVVKDLNGKDVYKVQGKFWTVTAKKFIQTLDGQTKYMVRNKFWRLFTYRAFVFDEKGEQVAHLRRKIFSFHDRFFIDSKFGKLEIKGNILCFDYHIFLDEKEILRVNKTYLGLIELILGIVVIVAPLEFAYVCIIWATWSIIRESYELKELITDIKTWPPRIISGAESIAVIAFSILLIFEPGEHHALIHMGLLVVELILNPFTVLLDEILIHFKEKKQAKLEEKEKDQ